MAKLKGLLPSLRERKRYLVFELISSKTFHRIDISKVIWDSLLQVFGEKGAAETGLLFVKDSFKNNKGILRVTHTAVNKIKTALLLVRDINKTPVILRTLGTSGILKKATTKFI